MSYNDQVTLEASFENWKQERAAGLTVDPFLYYCVEQFMKPFDLSDEEINYGITDGSDDGGVDAIYFLINRAMLVRDDSDVDHKNTSTAHLIIIQVKGGKDGFKVNETQKMVFFADDLLDLSCGVESLTSKYHPRLLEIMRIFKEKYRLIAGGFPSVNVDFYYINKADERGPHPNAVSAAEMVKEKVSRHLNRAQCNFNFINLQALLGQVSRRQPKARLLNWSWPPMQTEEGYVGLVKLRDYYKFICNEYGNIEDRIFEANVRAYQQSTPVNKEIRETLNSDEQMNFWLLNNGVTIIASKADNVGARSLSLEDPQIVNGLQTSREIFGYFSDFPTSTDERAILVKVIETTDAAAQDAIIKATNSQTRMQKASLRATDPIHRQIEELFKQYGLYYDRRKGFYKDKGTPISKIVSVPELLQALVSILLQRPDDARGRPSDYVKDDEKYDRLFGRDRFPLGIYLTCVLMMQRVKDFVDSLEIERNEKIDVKFYVASLLACRLTQEVDPSPDKLMRVNVEDIEETLLNDCFKRVWKMYQALGANASVARGPDLTKRLRAYVRSSLSAKK